jgi:hypothetical protein
VKLRCPACGAEISLDQAAQAADLLSMDKAAAAFGADWQLVGEYLDGFRSSPASPLALKKRLRLAREVWSMWESGKFAIGGAWYMVGREEFREALRVTCNQVGSGLSNHNYLKKVLVGAAEQTSQRQERELREREEGLMTTGRMPVPRRGDPAGRPERVAGGAEDRLPDDPAWRAEANRLGRQIRRAKTPEARAAAKAVYEEHLKTAQGGAG